MPDEPEDNPFSASRAAEELERLSPLGSPVQWRMSFTALAAEQAPLALASVVDLLHSRDPMARCMAARLILEYGMGKPVSADKHDAVNHRVLDGRGGAQPVRWSTPTEVTDAAMARAKDDAPISLPPLLTPPAPPVMSPEVKQTTVVVDDTQDDAVDAASEQPGVIAPLPIVDVAKMFGEDRGIATDGAEAPPKV